jgi:hypothetical protein
MDFTIAAERSHCCAGDGAGAAGGVAGAVCPRAEPADASSRQATNARPFMTVPLVTPGKYGLGGRVVRRWLPVNTISDMGWGVVD